MNSTASNKSVPARARRGIFVFAGFMVLLLLMLRSGLALLEFAAIIILGVFVLWPFLRRRNLVAWFSLLGVMALTGFAVLRQHQVLLSFLPQVLICMMFLLIFGRTLRPGSMPLITRISTDMRQGQSEVPLRYTRGLTWAWTLIFALLALEGLVLGLLASPGWVLKVNVLTWLLIGAFVACEYQYHSRRYPNPLERGFLDFARGLTRVDYRRLLDE